MPTPLQPAEADNANWNRLNSIWSELKDRIDVLISEIPRKRVRAKYSRMHRRTYKHIIEALQKDGVLEGALGPMLIDLDRRYSALRFRPKEVTPEDVELFASVRQIINKTAPCRRHQTSSRGVAIRMRQPPRHMATSRPTIWMQQRLLLARHRDRVPQGRRAVGGRAWGLHSSYGRCRLRGRRAKAHNATAAPASGRPLVRNKRGE
jgi:hypothetical protein